MMTVQDFYDRLELGKTVGQNEPDDQFVQRQIDGVTQHIVRYTGRRWELHAYEDFWTRPSRVFTMDVPVQTTPTPIVTANDVQLTLGEDYLIDPDTGQVYPLVDDGTNARPVRGDRSWAGTTKLKVEYQAGYAAGQVPESLLQVFDYAIGVRWNKRAANQTVAGAIGSGRSVKSVSIVGVGKTDYVTAADAAFGASPETAGDWLAGFPMASLDGVARSANWLQRGNDGAWKSKVESMASKV